MSQENPEGDKSIGKGGEAKAEQESVTKEAADLQSEATTSTLRDFRQRSEQNVSITPQLSAEAADPLTIVGLEGKTGKGAAVSEKHVHKPATGAGDDGVKAQKSEAPKMDAAKASDLTKPGIDKRTDKELEEAKDVKNVVHNADGSRTINYENGVSVTEQGDLVAKIEGPSKGDPPKRETREFGYDKDGEISYIKHPDGATWTSTPPSNIWTNKKTGETWQGRVDVDAASGAITWQDKATGDLVVQFADGTRTVEHADGSRIVTDENDRVVDVTGPPHGDGPEVNAFEYKYDHGELSYIKRPDGTVWTRNPQAQPPANDEWTLEGKNKKWSGKVTVDPDTGVLKYVTTKIVDGIPKVKTVVEKPDKTTITLEDGVKTTKMPDGTKITEKDNTKTIETDKDGVKSKLTIHDGLVSETEGPHGKYLYIYDKGTPPQLESITHPDGKTWTRQPPGDEWSYLDPKTKQRITWRGDVQVNPDTGAVTWSSPETGEKVTDSPNGSRTEKKSKDGPTVSTDSHGKVTRYEYAPPDSRVAEYKYDAKGLMTEATRPDGTHWKLNEKDGGYDIYDQSGKAIGKAGGPLEAGKDGSFSYEMADQTGRFGRHTDRVDGTSRVQFADGSSFERKGDKITEIEYKPDKDQTRGETRKFDFDGDKLVGFKDRDGSYWRYGPEEGKWTQYPNEKSQEPTSKTMQGHLEVDPGTGIYTLNGSDGTFVQQSPDGSKLTINPDRSSISESADGTKIGRDSRQRVTDVTYPPRPGEKQGQSRHFEYEGAAKTPATIADRDGSIWKKDPKSDTWTQYREKDGKLEAGRTWTGKVYVDPDSGEYTYASAGEKVQVTEKPDGTRVSLNVDDKGKPDGSGTVENPDGSRRTFDKDGPRRVTDASGKTSEYKYDAKLGVVEVTRSGATWTTKDGMHWTNQFGQNWTGRVKVGSDGSLTYKNGAGDDRGLTVVERMDGTRLYRPVSGGERVEDKQGRVIQTTNATGETYKFHYSDGKATVPTEVAVPDGTVFTAESTGGKPGSVHWKGKNPATGGETEWDGNVSFNRDKELVYTDSTGVVVTEKLDGAKITKDYDPNSQTYGKITYENADGSINSGRSRPPADRAELEKEAEDIWAATKGGWDAGAYNEPDVVAAHLRDKTEAEKRIIDEYIREWNDGNGLEDLIANQFDGSKKEELLMYARQKDDDKVNAADATHKLLTERGEWGGKSDASVESELRDNIRKMSSEKIEQLDKDYRAKYGVGIREAIADDPYLSQETKAFLDVYLKGSDKRTDEDTGRLAEIALEAKNIDLFKEAMADASPEARQKFMDQGGEEKVKAVFKKGHWYGIFQFHTDSVLAGVLPDWATGNITDHDYRHALDYAQYGKLSAASQVLDDTVWYGDNEKDIEDTLSKLSDRERELYMKGKEIASSPTAATSPSDIEALFYYQKLHAALYGAAGKFYAYGADAELGKWEDMIAVKGGSILSKLASHRGDVYDDRAGDVLSDIENMNDQQWKQAKAEYEKDPEAFKQKMRETLSFIDSYGFTDTAKINQVIAAFEAKMTEITYEDSQKVGRRSVTEMIADAKGFWNVRETDVLAAIGHMTPEEREKYKKNTDGFKDKVDAAVTSAMFDPHFPGELQAAQRILDLVARGIEPPEIIVKLNQHAMDIDADEEQVVKDVEQAFAESEARGDKPTLRERIQNPQTDEDRAIAEVFQASAAAAVGSWDVEYVNKAVKGKLSLEDRADLSMGTLSIGRSGDQDEIGFYDGIAKSSKEDREKFLALAKSNPFAVLNDYGLDADEQEIAKYAAEQGEMRPEDYMRAYVVGAGTSEQEIKDMLRGMTPEQKEQLKRDYFHKYGETLTGRLMDELGGKDKREVLQDIRREYDTAEEAYYETSEEYHKSVDGIGKAFVDAAWDGTGYKAEEAMRAFTEEMKQAGLDRENLSPEKAAELSKHVDEAIDTFIESKGAAADGLVDFAMAIAGLVPGGQSLWAYLALGAIAKVAAKVAIVGSDYDLLSSDIVVDAASGGVDAALNVLGPGEMAGVLKLGEKAAVTAAEDAAEKIIERLGKQALEEAERAGAKTGKELLRDGVKELIHESVGTASKEVEAKAALKLAEEVAGKTVKERAAKEFEEAAEKGLKVTAKGREILTEGTEKIAETAAKKAGTGIGKDETLKLARMAADRGASFSEIKDVVKTIKGLASGGIGEEQVMILAKKVVGKAASEADVKVLAKTIKEIKEMADKPVTDFIELHARELAQKAAAAGASPGEIKAIEATIKEAAQKAVTDINDVAKIIKESADGAIQQTGRDWVKQAVKKQGEDVFENDQLLKKAIERRAAELGKPVEEVVKNRKLLEEIADETARKVGKSADELLEARKFVKGAERLRGLIDQAIKYGSIAGSGALGGGASGAIMALPAWDGNKSFEENMKMLFESTVTSAGFGFAGGVAFTTVFEVGMKVGMKGMKVLMPRFEDYADRKAGKVALKAMEGTEAEAKAASKVAGGVKAPNLETARTIVPKHEVLDKYTVEIGDGKTRYVDADGAKYEGKEVGDYYELTRLEAAPPAKTKEEAAPTAKAKEEAPAAKEGAAEDVEHAITPNMIVSEEVLCKDARYGGAPALEETAVSPLSLDPFTATPEQILEAAGIDGQERIELLAEMRKSKSVSPEALRMYDQDFRELLGEWEKSSHIADGVRGKKQKLDSTLSALDETLRLQPKTKAQEDAFRAWQVKKDLKLVREAFDSDEVKAAMQRYEFWRDKHAEACKVLFDARKPALQEFLDKLAVDQGRPKVNVSMISSMEDPAAALLGLFHNGNLQVKASFILESGLEPAKFLKVLRHEWEHNWHYELVYRATLDELQETGIVFTKDKLHRFRELQRRAASDGSSLTPTERTELSVMENQFQELEVAFKEKTGQKELKDDFYDYLGSVLEAREGRRVPDKPRPTPEDWMLSDDERKQAVKFVESFKKSSQVNARATDASNSLSRVQSELDKLVVNEDGKITTNEEGVRQLVTKLSQDPSSSHTRNINRRLFGLDTPPPEVQQQIDHWRLTGNPHGSYEEAAGVLMGALTSHKTRIVSEIESAMREYYKLDHELDAFTKAAMLPEFSPDVGQAAPSGSPHAVSRPRSVPPEGVAAGEIPAVEGTPAIDSKRLTRGRPEAIKGGKHATERPDVATPTYELHPEAGDLQGAKLPDGTELRRNPITEKWEQKTVGSDKWEKSDYSYRLDEEGNLIREQFRRDGTVARRQKYTADGTFEGRSELQNLSVDVEEGTLRDTAKQAFESNPTRALHFELAIDRFKTAALAEGVPEESIARTLYHVNELLTCPEPTTLPRADREYLAEEILYYAADPLVIDQGQFDTCPAASLEKVFYLQDPAEAARIISEVARTGQYTTADGDMIRIPEDSIRLGADDAASTARELASRKGKYSDPKVDGSRTQSNQILQTTLMNISEQTKVSPKQGLQPGDRFYTIGKAEPGHSAGDTGERVVRRNPDGSTSASNRDVGMVPNDVVRVYEKVTGKSADGLAVQRIEHYGKLDSNKIGNISSPQDLEVAIKDAPKLPGENERTALVLSVFTGETPGGNSRFAQRAEGGVDTAGGLSGGGGGMHNVVVVGHRYEDGKMIVYVSNHWGRHVPGYPDEEIPVEELYDLMLHPLFADVDIPKAKAQDELKIRTEKSPALAVESTSSTGPKAPPAGSRPETSSEILGEDLRKYWKESGGGEPGKVYSEDVRATMQMLLEEQEASSAWDPEQLAAFKRLLERYQAKDEEAIGTVTKLLNPASDTPAVPRGKDASPVDAQSRVVGAKVTAQPPAGSDRATVRQAPDSKVGSKDSALSALLAAELDAAQAAGARIDSPPAVAVGKVSPTPIDTPAATVGFKPGESIPNDLQQAMDDGVPMEDARELVDDLRELEDPVISIPMKHLTTIRAKGRVEAKETWIGHQLLIGTLGRPAAVFDSTEPRFLARVINRDVRAIPRATGPDGTFHGVVGFNRDSLVVGRDIEIIIPPGARESVDGSLADGAAKAAPD